MGQCFMYGQGGGGRKVQHITPVIGSAAVRLPNVEVDFTELYILSTQIASLSKGGKAAQTVWLDTEAQKYYLSCASDFSHLEGREMGAVYWDGADLCMNIPYPYYFQGSFIAVLIE